MEDRQPAISADTDRRLTTAAPARSVSRSPVAPRVRRSLSVGAAGDRYEREADEMARQVMRSVMAGDSSVDHDAGSGDENSAGADARSKIQRRQAGGEQHVEVSDAPAKIQRRDTKFNPFMVAGRAKQNVSVGGLQLDHLQEHGLHYNEGGTNGNHVDLEKMVSDTGGDSAPGEPVEFGRFRMLHQPLVRANNQPNAATAMHAINHNFANPVLTNLRPENIFMGSARSNTKLHFNLVELPIRKSMKYATSGAATQYEAQLAAHPPTPSGTHPHILLWNAPGQWIPGTDVHSTPLTGPQIAPLPQATHTLDTSKLFNDVTWEEWPKIIRYTVVPHYSYQAHPNFPAFLLKNIADTEQDIADEQVKTAPNLGLITQVQNAVARLKVIAPDLFPEDFTCTAVYWFPSYDPAQPWYVSTESDIYSAEV